MRNVIGVGWLLSLILVVEAVAQDAVLPPPPPWSGKSRSLAIRPDDSPWVTPFEAAAMKASPNYDETMAWLGRLVKAAPRLHMISLGTSPEGREIPMVIASADGAFTPEALHRTGKPVFLAQAGIHPGEIDGKDAGMMLLRDMTVGVTKRDLLEKASFLFVPIFSVDGHERSSPHGRINQRGPQVTGWRTNARNLNLNRDYAKADTPEMQAMLRAIDRWRPDLYYDLHVTDGIDYQYDITFGWNGRWGWSPNVATWLDDVLRPTITADLERWEHCPGPLVFGSSSTDMSRGIIDWTASPRYSHGYGDARKLPTVLVENHSLKPYDQRVLGTYLLLESTLRLLGEHGESLRAAVVKDRTARPMKLPTRFRVPRTQAETIEFKGVTSRLRDSDISGGKIIEWLGEPTTLTIPYLKTSEPTGHIDRPAAYWIPPVWSEVIDRLAVHGIETTKFESEKTVEVEVYRLIDPKLDGTPFEGHARVTATTKSERRRITFAPGTIRVSTDQPLGDLAMLLLEPSSPDSFFRWGFFLEVLQRTEYAEAYVMEPTARRMLERDPKLKSAFEKKLVEDEKFAASPAARLQWFYERTPWFDDQWKIYPVTRELFEKKAGVETK